MTIASSEFQQVKSSMFSHIKYDLDRFVLSVRFTNGKVRAYQQVPPELYEEMMVAESIGKFYNSEIKGKFAFADDEEVQAWTGSEGGDGSVENQAQNSGGESGLAHTSSAASEDRGRVGAYEERNGSGGGDDSPVAGASAPSEVSAVSGTAGLPETARTSIPERYGLKDGEVLATCYVHMEDTPHWKQADGSMVCSLCHPNPNAPKKETAVAIPPQVLPALEPPKTAHEALVMLNEQSGLIEATVKLSIEEAQRALTMTVSNATSYAAAGEKMKYLRTVQDRAVAFLDPIRGMLYKTYLLAQDRLKVATQPIDTAISHLSGQRITWANEQELIRKAEEDRLQREREEQARKEQEERNQQLTLSAIEETLANGDEIAAEGLLLNPIETPAPYVPPVRVESTVPVEQGISKRPNWKGEVVDLEALILDVAEGILDSQMGKGRGAHLPTSFLEANMTAINQMVKAQKEASQIPGVRVFNAAVESVRRGK